MSLWKPKNSYQEKIANGLTEWLGIILSVLLIVVCCLFVPLVIGTIVMWIDSTFFGGPIAEFWVEKGLLRTQKWYWWMSIVITGLPFVLLFFAVNWWKERWNAPDDRLGGAENVDD